MPNVETHCKISKERTRGNEFRELHEWIDAPQEHFGTNHRIERHTLNDIYLNYVKENWDDKGVIEWLFHIAIDNMETANKFAVKAYNKSFNEMHFMFDGKKLSRCDFIKNFSTSNTPRCFSIDLKEKIKVIQQKSKEPTFTKEELMLLGFNEMEAETLLNETQKIK